MKKSMKIWTIELPDKVTLTNAMLAMVQGLGGEVVDLQEKTTDLTDEECKFWYNRWWKLPFSCCRVWNNTTIAYCFRNGELKSGKAKCCPGDVFNEDFGYALAAARLFGDCKLERALLRFTPEQIKKYF